MRITFKHIAAMAHALGMNAYDRRLRSIPKDHYRNFYSMGVASSEDWDALAAMELIQFGRGDVWRVTEKGVETVERYLLAARRDRWLTLQKINDDMNSIESITRVWDEDTLMTIGDRIDTIYRLIDLQLVNSEFGLLDEFLAKLADLPNLAKQPQLGLAVLIATKTANSEISNKQAFIISFQTQLKEALGKDRSERLLYGFKVVLEAAP